MFLNECSCLKELLKISIISILGPYWPYALLFFGRQHPPHTNGFPSKPCVRVPSSILYTDHQPGCVQHLHITSSRRLRLTEWHPCSQPVMDHMWPLCTVPCNQQLGYERSQALSTSLHNTHIISLMFVRPLLQIITKTGGKQLKAALCMC